MVTHFPPESQELFSVSIHGDLLLDVLQRRRHRGEVKVLLRRHLEPLRQAGVRVQVLPVFVSADFLPDSALRQAMRIIQALYEELEETPETFRLVHTQADLDQALAADQIALILAFEGAEPLDRDPGLVRLFQRLGLRMLGLTWNRANQFAQGLAEDTGAGLSVVGRDLLDVMQRLNIALDVSHMSAASFWAALDHFRGPVLASHANAWGATPHPRNLTDDQLKAIAERGGLVGLCFIPRLAGGDLVTGLVRHADHIRKVIGLERVALAADFANFLPDLGEPPRRSPLDAFEANLEEEPASAEPDVTMLPDLHRGFLANGWSLEDTAAVFGGNALRFLRALLPPA